MHSKFGPTDLEYNRVATLSRLWPVIAVLVLIASSASHVMAKSDAASLQAEYRQLTQHFAAANPAWRPQPPASGSLLFIASDEYSPLADGAEAPDAARKKIADELFELAKRAADSGQLSLAFQWATETVRENPDHAEARRVLGYDQREGQWLTAYGVKMFDAGKVWDAKSGWIAVSAGKGVPQNPLPLGEGGVRESNKAPSPQPSPKGRGSIKSGWQIHTDHFWVTTDRSQAAGAELAARLERLYQIWRQLFAGFYYSEKEVRGLFAGERNARIQFRPFHVFYYRDRDEYVAALRRRQPRIGETLGIYFDAYHEAHFFAADDVTAAGSPAATTAEPAVATLYHEAVHQLFQESKPTPRQIGVVANFGIVEGVAAYFETLTEHRDPKAGLYFTIGESTAGRLPVGASGCAKAITFRSPSS